ncbi:hypothetical protein QYE76_053114 [Lolium multiflorum]|uniref:Transposase (putative) gypsy type domain-containing protein n=1 Tax=Lolium multiflorum TaxID=4521 RepID=A0AAD8SW08_LOLMU|nr:hypothetical protein QYE76_053114 [Lolium multiflorum]
MEILKAYQLQPHNISPNSILAISNHVTLCEGHLRVTPDLSLFQYYFSVKKEKVSQTFSLATCGSITFKLRPGRIYPHTDHHESVRYWSGGFFYLKDVSDLASSKVLPEFKDGPASDTPTWTQCPHLSKSPQMTKAVRRICKLSKDGLSGKDLTMSWFTKRIQPLQHRDRLMLQYTGHNDLMRASKDNLSADALDKRIWVLIKIPRDLQIHLEALEEKDLRTLTRVPHAGNTDPEAASEAEALEAPVPTKRKRGASSGPASKRAREAPSAAATRKAEQEKQRLKQIDTSKQSQPNIAHSENKPPKNPKKKAKPSPATMPITPEVEVPPKASSSAMPDPKDVINLDDLPEEPIAESGKGESGKGESDKVASSSHPPPEDPDVTSTEATTNDAKQKLLLSGATGTPQTHPHFFTVLQKVPLAQRRAEISHLMNEVWGNPETEQQELTTLEGNLKIFFAKHKNVRQVTLAPKHWFRHFQNTRKLHEDLRVLVLEQKMEIEGLHKNYAESQKAITIPETRVKNHEEELANRPSINEISAELESEKELEEKHAQAMSELADRLKKSNQRVKTLASKAKAYETEAENIDKMIFPSLGFEWTKESTLSRTEAYEEAQNSIDDLFEACRGIAKSLSLKRAGTTLIDRMTKLMRMVPDLIKDWQESSSRGVASITLEMCKAHFPTMSFASVARGVSKGTNIKAALAETQGYDRLFAGRVNHSFWYNKYALPDGFSDAEDDEDDEDVEEGSGSCANHSNEDGSGEGSAYEASEDEEQSSD